MLKPIRFTSLIFCLWAVCSGQAFAGPEAHVYACLYMSTKPIDPLSVAFVAGGSVDHCMVETGHNSTVQVSEAGLTCTSVGLVEGKLSGECAVPGSGNATWELSYTIAGSSFSGSTESTWTHPVFESNHMHLHDETAGTVVCSNEALCNSTSIKWDSGSTGPLYIIFTPGASTGN